MNCGAKTRAGTPCKKPSVIGKTRCRLHGGLSPSGEAHYNYKHGRYTKESKLLAIEVNARLKLLAAVAIEFGMIENSD
ncbi:hypothetical protein MCEKH45_01088 [Methylophilaceae bacterium]|jgi:hypothetical protein